jgi:hypothetical protein
VGSSAVGILLGGALAAALSGCTRSPCSGRAYGGGTAAPALPAPPPRDLRDAAAACPAVLVAPRRFLPPEDRVQIPIAENRSSFLVPVLPPSPFLLTQGQARTPRRGGVSAYAQRLSDERDMIDANGSFYRSDGELQLLAVEYVSPCIPLHLGRTTVPLHLGVSLHAVSLEYPLLDEVRNFVEEELLGATGDFIENRSIGGSELSIDPIGQPVTDVLDGVLFKVKAVAKVDLPEACVLRRPLRSAFSVGVTPPAFGHDDRSGNESVAVDAALAYAYPLSPRFRLTGAFALSVPGGSALFDDLGLHHEDVLFAGHANVEWWFHPRWAFTLGLSHHTNYLRDSELPMDLDSTYINVGFLWQASCSSAFYVTWTENVETQINTIPGSDFSKAQKEADFTLAIGWRHRF